jgi:hypothetical protein
MFRSDARPNAEMYPRPDARSDAEMYPRPDACTYSEMYHRPDACTYSEKNRRPYTRPDAGIQVLIQPGRCDGSDVVVQSGAHHHAGHVSQYNSGGDRTAHAKNVRRQHMFDVSTATQTSQLVHESRLVASFRTIVWLDRNVANLPR